MKDGPTWLLRLLMSPISDPAGDSTLLFHPLNDCAGSLCSRSHESPSSLAVAALIASPKDLRGRSVGMGPSGSGTAVGARMILDAFGLKDIDVRAEPLGFQEASERVLDGTLDAMFGYAVVPSESVISALRGGASFVPIEGPEIDRLRQRYPFVKITAIPLGMYPMMTKSIHTVGVDALLVCREGLDEGLVYELTKALVNSLRPSTHPGLLPGAELGQLPATPITLHDGAARYHRERKLSR